MRTIDRVQDPVSAYSAPRPLSRAATVLRRLVSILQNRITRRRNRTCDLDRHQLRDIGLEAGLEGGLAVDRAARQDALLREAQAKAILLSRNIGGR
ncbi:hypothetical protein [Rhizobium sp. SSA_523]|uniref:hypothetical protein n=1 Tax=Rhizobium sp. SSA_523 TaxID=2952477 RepID=UPI00209143BE|nr:hypothetical protein [Rhizobium sp. SSA_523]MCO5730839.1 hypothetical protein [Rhizobium sp. SSA_523]WKC24340.1 hypothetical protein QTJ18_09755 [Rhizobium sp. SSA_523]